MQPGYEASYRLKFFVVRLRNHLWDGNSLPQLQSSWLRSTRGSRRSKYTEGVARRIATRRSNQECEEVPRYSLQINDDVCGFHPVLYATHSLIFHVHADEKITSSCVEKCRVAAWLPCRDHTCRLQLLLRLVTPSTLALSNFRSFYFHFRIRSEHSK